METNLIEKYDHNRTNLLLGATIGWGLWYGLYILKEYILNKPALLILIGIGMIGWMIMAYSFVSILKLGKKIKKDPVLSNALNNEWIVLTKRKAITVGYWCMILSLIVFLVITAFYSPTAKTVVQIIFFIGILSQLISFLILTRNSHE